MALWMIEIQYVIRNEKIRNKNMSCTPNRIFFIYFYQQFDFSFFISTVNRITYIRRECMQIPDIDQGQ